MEQLAVDEVGDEQVLRLRSYNPTPESRAPVRFTVITRALGVLAYSARGCAPVERLNPPARPAEPARRYRLR
jgi:hypothetical protein